MNILTQARITEIGERLIAEANEIKTLPELKSFYDSLNDEVLNLVTENEDERTMPLGWVASRITEDAQKRFDLMSNRYVAINA